MAILGPFIAQNRERRVYFNGHGMAGLKIWAVEGREGRCLIQCSRRMDRDSAVRYVSSVLGRMKDEGRIPERWPPFEVLFDAAEHAKAEGWGDEEKGPDAEKLRRKPSHGFEGFPELFELYVDPDADADIVAFLARIPNLVLLEEKLEAGNFICRNAEGVTLLAIERTTREEFSAALYEDGSGLFVHAQALKRAGAQAVLLIEGNLFADEDTPLGQMSSLMSFLAVAQGISLVPTASAEHSAYTIARMVRHAAYGFGRDVLARDGGPLGAAARGKAIDRMAAIVAAAAGIGPGRARQVVEAFPSLKAVANATVDDLTRVNFIGRGTAEAIVKAFSAEHGREEE